MIKTKVAITGALSYTGRYITKQLIQRFGATNLKIVNIENVDLPNPFANEGLEMETVPYSFDDPDRLKRSIEGSKLMVGTYWVRFDDHKAGITRDKVIQNAKTLVDCARDSGVERYVYTSHTQSDVNCHIPYIAGKAKVEQYVKEEFAGRNGIIKPCAVFGETPNESILINNITFLMRTFRCMPVVGKGDYPFHPVHVEDMARLCIEAGFDDKGEGAYDWDACAPEKTSFVDVLKILQKAKGIENSCFIIKNVPESVAYNLTRPLNMITGDILIDRTDTQLMTEHITCTKKEPLGTIKLSDWAMKHRDTLGVEYINSMKRYYTR